MCVASATVWASGGSYLTLSGGGCAAVEALIASQTSPAWTNLWTQSSGLPQSLESPTNKSRPRPRQQAEAEDLFEMSHIQKWCFNTSEHGGLRASLLWTPTVDWEDKIGRLGKFERVIKRVFTWHFCKGAANLTVMLPGQEPVIMQLEPGGEMAFWTVWLQWMTLCTT